MFSVSLTPAGGILQARRPDREGQRPFEARERCLSSSQREVVTAEGVTLVTGVVANAKCRYDLDNHNAVLTVDQQHLHVSWVPLIIRLMLWFLQ